MSSLPQYTLEGAHHNLLTSHDGAHQKGRSLSFVNKKIYVCMLDLNHVQINGQT